MHEVRIGASGWHYQHWRGPFYPEDLPSSKMLDFYAQRFDTVELNNSFYKLPTETVLAGWRDATPPGFLFAMKASRFITHNKKLKDPQNTLEKFLPRAEVLGRKLGPILFQLPPGWKCNLERLEAFLTALPRTHRYALEFRNPTWHIAEVYRILKRHNAAFCAFDLAGFQSPIEITANFAYVRLHGPGGKYQGSYSRRALAGWAKRICEWSKTLNAIYVYFDNDQSGFAVQNAQQLKEAL